MKIPTAFICLIAFVSCTNKTSTANQDSQPSVAETPAPNNNTGNDTAIKTIRSFYTEYITADNGMPVNETQLNSIKRKYCTPRLIHALQQDEMDYDPFLNAQDCDLSWISTLSVKRDTEEHDLYYVQYKDTASKETIHLKLKLKYGNGEYKIDKVYSVMESPGI